LKFTVSTKPLVDSLDLGIVNANVSKFYQRSTVAQITATKTDLKINLEAASIVSEIHLKGSGDSDTKSVVFVDSLLFKQLVSTFETSTTEFEFTENGLILHSGKSKFTLPKMIDDDDVELDAPSLADYNVQKISIDKSDWKFIKDYQMYAIAMSFIHPVYTRVWVGEDGQVLVGDFDNSLFTYSKKNNLNRTCLLADTIINLFNALPEGAEIAPLDKSYVVNVKTDSYEFIAEFTPEYEDEDDIGSYNSAIILNLMTTDENNTLKFDISPIKKALDQSSLLSSNSEDKIEFSVIDNQIILKDNNIESKVDVKGNDSSFNYSLQFKTESLKSVVSKLPSDTITLSPMISGEGSEVVGVVIESDGLTVVLAGVD
jgi:hypothetical protein